MLARSARGFLSRACPPCVPLLNSRGFAIETGPMQTDAPMPKKPFVQEDFQGVKQQQREVYESMKAQVSGTAEDVRLMDQTPTSLGKMGVESKGPENERVKEARQMAASSEREMEDPELAEAVFDDTKSSAERMDTTTSSRGMMKPSGTATAPQ